MIDRVNKIQIGLDKNYTRREFIISGSKKIGMIALGTYTISLINSCADESNPTGPNNTQEIKIDITQSPNQALQNIGGTIAIGGNDLDNSGMLIIRKSETEVVALSRRCTHQGCTIPNFINGVSTCPCHGSKYNSSGGVVNGPAQNPLKKYNAVLTNNIITITT